jgi:hypothetical protein
MYLGDGYICRVRRTYRLEVYLYRDDERGIARVGPLFSQACQLAGVRYTRASRVTISIARRAEVAGMDTIMSAPEAP